MWSACFPPAVTTTSAGTPRRPPLAGVALRDGRPELTDAGGVRVAREVGPDRRDRGLLDEAGSRKIRLAGAEVDDVHAPGAQGRGGLQDLERRGAGDAGCA